MSPIGAVLFALVLAVSARGLSDENRFAETLAVEFALVAVVSVAWVVRTAAQLPSGAGRVRVRQERARGRGPAG